MSQKIYISYEDVHRLVDMHTDRIIQDFAPDVILAIGRGGSIPGLRVSNNTKKDMIYVGLKSYSGHTECEGGDIRVIQWLDTDTINKLKGKKVLIVDEIDDTRETIEYCVNKLRETCDLKELGVFVLFNKNNKKSIELEELDVDKYYAAEEKENLWIMLPWDIY
jgi:hypoxanthine phosphoribosyltransferase